MYKRIRIKKLGRTRSHREALIANQLRTLFEYGYVRTTSPKAGVLKSRADRLIAKYSEDLSFRRKIGEILGTKKLVDSFVKYAKKDIKGVKIFKVGFRPGDMGEVSRVELINFKDKIKKEEPVKKEEKKGKKRVERKGMDKKVLERENLNVPATKNLRVNKERAKSRSGL